MKKFILSVIPKRLLGHLSRYIYRPFHSYSGEGEDCVTARIFSGKKDGFYVDVGCFHPVIVSNTLHLYRSGWRGINIDADQYKIDIFEKSRPRDTNICVAISDTEGEAEFFFQSGESYGSMSGLVQSEAERRAKVLGRTLLSRTVRTKPLAAILESEGVTKIDYLSIDVEGAEEAVLSTVRFDSVEIDLIAVEIHGDFETVFRSPVHSMLSGHGYEIVAWTPPTVFYRRPAERQIAHS